MPINIVIMSFRITCYTLFDITQTGVLNRSRPLDDENYSGWVYKRNTQANFDTILQVINLRSQPEIVDSPKKIDIRFDEFEHFGFLFQQEQDIVYPCWTFEFDIQHYSVFDDGESELGALYNDCHNVPMILCGSEWNKLPNFLDTSPELKNIYFHINDE
jgi:hypothetical protein